MKKSPLTKKPKTFFKRIAVVVKIINFEGLKQVFFKNFYTFITKKNYFKEYFLVKIQFYWWGSIIFCEVFGKTLFPAMIILISQIFNIFNIKSTKVFFVCRPVFDLGSTFLWECNVNWESEIFEIKKRSSLERFLSKLYVIEIVLWWPSRNQSLQESLIGLLLAGSQSVCCKQWEIPCKAYTWNLSFSIVVVEESRIKAYPQTSQKCTQMINLFEKWGIIH